MARSNALAGAKSDQRYQWLRNTTPAHIPRNASSDQSLAGAAIGGPGLSTAEISLPTRSGAMIFDRDNALASAPETQSIYPHDKRRRACGTRRAGATRTPARNRRRFAGVGRASEPPAGRG